MTLRAAASLPVILELPEFWQRVEEAPHRLLALDYDGTLAPFRVDRLKAYPLEGIVPELNRIINGRGTELAVLSGRPISELLLLLGDIEITLVGSHGFEVRHAGENPAIHAPSPLQKEGLNSAGMLATDRKLDQRLEPKVASQALHTRGMEAKQAEELERSIFEAWSSIAEDHDLECRLYNGGVELRCTQRDKGKALAELLERQPDGSLCVYAGDDQTDEDAFKAIGGTGVGIKVGGHDSETEASAFLPDIESMLGFLKKWPA